MENEDHPESQSHAVFIPLSYFFAISAFLSSLVSVPQIPLFPNQADPTVMYYSFRDSIPFKYGSGSSFPLLAAQSCQNHFL